MASRKPTNGKRAKERVENPRGPRRRAKVATLSFRLVFVQRGPLDPATITAVLGVAADEVNMGEPQINVRGELTGRTNVHSAWTRRLRFYDEEPAGDDNDYKVPELGLRLMDFLQPLLDNADFVRGLAAECDAAFVSIQFPGQWHYGGELEPAVLDAVASLGLNLGIEVFPNSAT
jgi:hypothetical protein